MSFAIPNGILEMLDFVSEHATDEDSKWNLEQFRPYVLMMNTRARASLELKEGNTGGAVKLIEAGKAKNRDLLPIDRSTGMDRVE